MFDGDMCNAQQGAADNFEAQLQQYTTFTIAAGVEARATAAIPSAGIVKDPNGSVMQLRSQIWPPSDPRTFAE